MEELSTPPKIQPASLTSPKRKREQDDECLLVPSRLRIQPSRSGAGQEAVSPRGTVISQFQALGLHHDLTLPSLTKGGKKTEAERISELQEEISVDQKPPLSMEDHAGADPITGISLSQSAKAQVQVSQSASIVPTPSASCGPMSSSQATEAAASTPAPTSASASASASAHNPPPTPLLKPSTPSSIRTISPLPTARVTTSSIPPVFLSTPSESVFSKPGSKADAPSPLKRMHIPLRPRSPPPPPLTMLTSTSSIKSNSSDDSLDEAFGLNGIGFRPTPAVAYARMQRRKQQVAEWKNREAREARQRRSERRRSSGIVPLASVSGNRDEEESGMAVEGRRRVRFVEG